MAERLAADPGGERLADVAAPAVLEAFATYTRAFSAITLRAAGRFENRDWVGAAADATERLDLYGRAAGRAQQRVSGLLGDRLGDRDVWARMRSAYSGLILGREDWELAETFFNSVTRRVFSTSGVDANIEFVDSDFEIPGAPTAAGLHRVYEAGDTAALMEAVLRDSWLARPVSDASRHAREAARLLEQQLAAVGRPGPVTRAEVLREPFFRRRGAYLVGRVLGPGGSVPFGLALLHQERGVIVDAVLAGEDDISILFSFTRSHFHIALGPSHELVAALKALLPLKPVADLYIALGHHNHGKTELFRDLRRHLAATPHQFELAEGTPGMVMIVFAIAGYDGVVKIIRDRFPAIKPVTPEIVRSKYRLVFHHDRAGRLVEAQEFEHLELDRALFGSELLAELRRDASLTVEIGEDVVRVRHAYLERRVNPLDVHLRAAPVAAAAAAVRDFGQTIKDLAASGIFPGELLPKNFGLTRHARVVCYDYDELSLLTDFVFRTLPPARDDEDELADEAWFGVGPWDVFPEEFGRFLGLTPELRAELESVHSDLYDAAYWQTMQARLRRGETIDIFPYPAARRLPAPD
ncbi:MAG: bifunctional isocitrate dehydrogenase kinase/phosphatase [Candidatus Dormibacteraeota bacterium]|nr:bifunctional isocitrate dehydrogenase kinase/phosphatase [Candidatus Dormibacteraeota bacterium]